MLIIKTINNARSNTTTSGISKPSELSSDDLKPKLVNIFLIMNIASLTVLLLKISSPITTKKDVFNICNIFSTLLFAMFNFTYNLLNDCLVMFPIDMNKKWYNPNKMNVHPAPCHNPLRSQTTNNAMVPLNNGP